MLFWLLQMLLVVEETVDELDELFNKIGSSLMNTISRDSLVVAAVAALLVLVGVMLKLAVSLFSGDSEF
jgi:flagellar biosynthesis regulator FlbT